MRLLLAIAALLGLSRPRLLVRFRFWLGKGKQSFIEGENLMSRLTIEQRALVEVIARTAGGHVARIDGEVLFASSDTTVAQIYPVAGEPNKAYVYGVAPGVAQISATFDADLGEGVRNITGTTALEVVEAEAVGIELNIGPAELQPPPIEESNGSESGNVDPVSTGGDVPAAEPDNA